MPPSTAIITGGCGFVGHHVVEHCLAVTDWNLIVLDSLAYSSHSGLRLEDAQVLHSPRVQFYTWDLSYPLSPGLKHLLQEADLILHIAAQSHVDDSIADPRSTIRNNVMSTVEMLELARELTPRLRCFLMMSTDETYGPVEVGDAGFVETSRHQPSNPYSASKSASEKVAFAYWRTYGVPVVTVNAMNIFGERQHVEKFIPKVLSYLLQGKTVPIHTNDRKEPGSRHYIHARNVADALVFLTTRGQPGETYHIEGEEVVDNLSMAQFLSQQVDQPLQVKLEASPKSRPGHDLHYNLNGSKLYALGWRCPKTFWASLTKMTQWTLQNPVWLEEHVTRKTLEAHRDKNVALGTTETSASSTVGREPSQE